MKKMSNFLLFFCFTSLVYAQKSDFEKPITFDTLIGTLPSLIRCNDRPYIVTSNIEVPPDRTVTIEPGTVLLFRNFSGLHVRGRLIARGTPEKPIVFTSEFDRQYNPSSTRNANPFDWDGIYMTLNSLGTQFTHVVIAYSVYCITSESKFIRLDPLTVIDNGKSVITIDQQEYPLTDTLFTYTLDNVDISDKKLNLFRDPVAKKRTIFRILGSTLMLGGAVGGIYYAVELNKDSKTLQNLSETDFVNLNTHTNADWKKNNENVNNDKWFIGGSSFVLLGGLAFFTWTFTF
jgi:hypothetical protein